MKRIIILVLHLVPGLSYQSPAQDSLVFRRTGGPGVLWEAMDNPAALGLLAGPAAGSSLSNRFLIPGLKQYRLCGASPAGAARIAGSAEALSTPVYADHRYRVAASLPLTGTIVAGISAEDNVVRIGNEDRPRHTPGAGAGFILHLDGGYLIGGSVQHAVLRRSSRISPPPALRLNAVIPIADEVEALFVIRSSSGLVPGMVSGLRIVPGRSLEISFRYITPGPSVELQTAIIRDPFACLICIAAHPHLGMTPTLGLAWSPGIRFQ